MYVFFSTNLQKKMTACLIFQKPGYTVLTVNLTSYQESTERFLVLVNSKNGFGSYNILKIQFIAFTVCFLFFKEYY